MPSSFRSFAIVPAAGKSRRMGQDKLLLPWGESTVLESLLAAWRASRVDEIHVVTRRDRLDIIDICKAAGVTVVAPDEPLPEMKDSVRAALEHLAESFGDSDLVGADDLRVSERIDHAGDVWLLAPADMPELKPAVIDEVLAAHDPDAPQIIVPVEVGKRGHPVLFPWSLAGEVDTLADHEGVNALLKRHRVREIECLDARIHNDLDTPADYDKLCPE